VTAIHFLLLNLALAFYNVGAIWAHEVDIFRSWRHIGRDEFHDVQRTHLRKLPYWIFLPVGLALAGSVALLRFRPTGSPQWCPWAALGLQLLSAVLTGVMWGPWQAKLAQDPIGPKSTYLTKILRTHWLRTLLINAYAFVLLLWVWQAWR
jgi:hypothetical protein